MKLQDPRQAIEFLLQHLGYSLEDWNVQAVLEEAVEASAYMNRKQLSYFISVRLAFISQEKTKKKAA
jgi:hypothetical protein